MVSPVFERIVEKSPLPVIARAMMERVLHHLNLLFGLDEKTGLTRLRGLRVMPLRDALTYQF